LRGFLEEAALIADVDRLDEEPGRSHIDDSSLCKGCVVSQSVLGSGMEEGLMALTPALCLTRPAWKKRDRLCLCGNHQSGGRCCTYFRSTGACCMGSYDVRSVTGSLKMCRKRLLAPARRTTEYGGISPSARNKLRR